MTQSAQKEAAPSLPPPPKKLGRYTIVDRLGAGGMAEVLLAVKHGAAGVAKAVAIKRILPQFAQNEEFIRLLQQEAAIAVMMHHPNCVQVNDLEGDGDEFYIEMELLMGAPISALHKSARKAGGYFPVGIAARIGSDAARGLHYVHGLEDSSGNGLGIIHRDISPQNLFVTEGGLTKVLDFGIAKAVEGLESHTRTGVLKGKYTFMSPEQVTFKAMDGRSDVWSLAVTMWELLTSKRLFARAGFLEVLEAIKSSPIPPPSAIRPDIPKSLDAVILKALERDPDKRSTAGQLADELDQIARVLPDGGYSEVSAFCRKHAGPSIEKMKTLVSGAGKMRSKRTTQSVESVAPVVEEEPTPPPRNSVSGTRPIDRESSGDVAVPLVRKGASRDSASSPFSTRSSPSESKSVPKMPRASTPPPASAGNAVSGGTAAVTAVVSEDEQLVAQMKASDDVVSGDGPIALSDTQYASVSHSVPSDGRAIPSKTDVVMPKTGRSRDEHTASRSFTIEPSRYTRSTKTTRRSSRRLAIEVTALVAGLLLGLIVYMITGLP